MPLTRVPTLCQESEQPTALASAVLYYFFYFSISFSVSYFLIGVLEKDVYLLVSYSGKPVENSLIAGWTVYVLASGSFFFVYVRAVFVCIMPI